MILHIPVEGTSEGGKLRVNYNGEEKYFYFNADSDKQFYSTIFFTNCQHKLEEVSSGTKVLMVFNLAWKTPLKTVTKTTSCEDSKYEDIRKSSRNHRTLLPENIEDI